MNKLIAKISELQQSKSKKQIINSKKQTLPFALYALPFALCPLFFALCSLLFAFCTTPPDYPIVPHIDFQSMSKTTMRQGFGSEDSVYVTFSFTDGDGDLGTSPSDPTLNVFTFSRLFNQATDSFRIPFVPVQGTKNGISGTIQLRLLTTCCKSLEPCKPSKTHPVDTLIYDISIKDRAGHLSNVISTPPILLRCD